MSSTVQDAVNIKPTRGGEASGSGDFPRGNGGRDGPGDWPPGVSSDDASEPRKYQIGIWVALGSILMLFAALTSALIVRQTPALNGGLKDWISISVPPMMWFNTGVLLLSSVTIEVALRTLKHNLYHRFRNWLCVTTPLGIVFLAGQVIAGRELAEQGIYINTHPHSSFFYLLTSLHGIHLLGGVLALISVTISALRLRISVRKRLAMGAASVYWHFMDGLWVYLFVLLFFWR